MNPTTPTSFMDFGRVQIGASKTLTLRIRNVGDAPTEVVLQTDAPFSVHPAQVLIEGGGSSQLEVSFAPSARGSAVATLDAETGSDDILIPLWGEGVVDDILSYPDASSTDGGSRAPDASTGAPDASCDVSFPPVVDFGDLLIGAAERYRFAVDVPNGANCVISPITLVDAGMNTFTTVTAAPPPSGSERRAIGVQALTSEFGTYEGLLQFSVGGELKSVLVKARLPQPCERDASYCVFDPPTERVYLNQDRALYSYDPASGTATAVSTLWPVDSIAGWVTDIAILPDGGMYASSGSSLYRVDPSSGRMVLSGSLPNVSGLGATHDGLLLGAGDGVMLIDPVTAQIVSTLVPPGGPRSSGDVLELSDGGILWTVQGGDSLHFIDRSAGSDVELGNLGVPYLFGLFEADGQTIAASETGQMYLVDPFTGSLSQSASTSHGWFGAASWENE